MMSEQLPISAIRLFAHYAGQDRVRWQKLIGQRVTHKTFGNGTVVDVTRRSGGKPVIHITFLGDDPSSRGFTEEALDNQAYFSEVAVPLDAATVEAARHDLLEATRRAAEQATTQRQRDEEQRRSRVAPVPRRSTSAARLTDNALLEVLAVPVGDTYQYVLDYDVHAHPARYPYRMTQYITFRWPGGRMWKIYDLGRAHMFRLNPHDPVSARERIIATQRISESEKERVRRYCTDRTREGNFKAEHNEDFTFYVLPTDGNIDLPHGPSPEQTVQGHTYFDLFELQSGRAVARTLTQKDWRQ